MPEPQPNTVQLRKAKLAKADLTDKDLRGADLTGAILTKAKLAGLDLTGAVLEKSNLENADLTGATLDRVRARGARMAGTWSGVRATEADFTEATGQKWRLEDCRLTKINFAKINARRLVFERCTLQDCDFTKATLPDVTFLDCRVDNCRFDDADLSCPSVKNTTFAACRFVSADLSGSVVEQAVLRACDLTKADWIAGEFRGLSLEDAKLDKANFRFASGLSDDELANIKARGGRISRRLLRKTLDLAVGTWPGRVVSLLLIVFLATAIYLYNRNPENWSNEKLQRVAERARLKGNPEIALSHYDLLLARHAHDPIRVLSYRMERARTYTQMRDLDRALAEYEAILATPNFEGDQRANMQIELLDVLVRQGKTDLVMQKLNDVAPDGRIGGSVLTLVNQMTDTTNDEKVWRLAEAQYDRLEQTADRPLKAEIALSRGILYRKLGRAAEAEKLLMSVETMPESPGTAVRHALMSLANLRQEQGRLDEARQALARVRELFPEERQEATFAQLNEAGILANQRRYPEAVRMLQDLIAQGDTELGVRSAKLALGNIYLIQRQFDHAAKLVEEVVDDSDPGSSHNVDARLLLAAILLEQGKNQKAISLLTATLAEAGDLRTILRAKRDLVSAYRRIDKPDKALEVMATVKEDQLEEREKHDHFAAYADLLAATSRFDEAAAYMWKAVQRSTGQQSLLDHQNYFDILRRGGEFKRVRAELEKLLTDTPADTDLNLWADLELLRLDFEEKKNEAYLKRLHKITARPLQTGMVPPNFQNATAMNDPTTRELIEGFLTRVIAVEDARGFVGASARLHLANLWLNQEKRIDENDIAKRIEAMAGDVIRLSQDPNLLIQAFDTRGKLARQRHEYDRAFAVYDEMATQAADPRLTAMAVFFKGETLLDQGQTANAFATLTKAQETCADRADCCRIADFRARKYMELQDKPRAREVYTLIRDKLPECWVRGEALQMLEQLK